jgi:hypothetical protein
MDIPADTAVGPTGDAAAGLTADTAADTAAGPTAGPTADMTVGPTADVTADVAAGQTAGMTGDTTGDTNGDRAMGMSAGMTVDVAVDVVVWRAPGPASSAEAAARYAELRASPLGAFEPAVAAFVRELRQTSPDPASAVSWHEALTVGTDAVIVHVVWPGRQQVLDLVALLAARHGLVCYEPARQVAMS